LQKERILALGCGFVFWVLLGFSVVFVEAVGKVAGRREKKSNQRRDG